MQDIDKSNKNVPPPDNSDPPPAGLRASDPDIQAWLQSNAGQKLLQLELLQSYLLFPKLYGNRLLQIGAWGFGPRSLELDSVLNHWVVGKSGAGGISAVLDFQTLPIMSKCLDVVFLPHSLELAESPHRLLREVDRVLCDHGHVVIMGFNPISPWYLWQTMGWSKPRYPRKTNCYSMGRIRDWLELLDFEIIKLRRYGGVPWLPRDGVNAAAADWRALTAILAQAYAVVARKCVVPLTPVAKKWRKDAKRPVPGLAEPTPRSMPRDRV